MFGMEFVLFLPLIVLIATTLLVGLVRRYALKSLLDHPNERSSHLSPTPRGGGLAIAIVFHAVVALLWWQESIESGVAIALLGGGVVLSIIGWIDDHRHVSAAVRAVFHLLAAFWAVYWLGGLSQLNLGSFQLPLPMIGSVLAVIGVVWLINLYNFMDGIDGIAGGQGVVAALMGGLLLWLGGNQGLAMLAWALAAACAGFLVWNWSPARIFMGDVGSGLIGFIFAVFALASEKGGAVPLLIWILLLLVFVVDATLTLMKRLIRGEKWYTAHRSHGYQLLVQKGWSHRRVSMGVLGIGMVVLWPLALWGWWVPELMVWLFLTAATLLVLVWWRIQRCCAAR